MAAVLRRMMVGIIGMTMVGETEDTGLITRDSVNIQKDCGEDNICIPDLKINFSG